MNSEFMALCIFLGCDTSTSLSLLQMGGETFYHEKAFGGMHFVSKSTVTLQR